MNTPNTPTMTPEARPTLYFGADHGGFAMKAELKQWFEAQGYQVVDCGADQLDAEDDYPDFAQRVAQKVAADPQGFGVLACRSSAGMVIMANKVKGIRAVSVFTPEQAVHAREHNNANVIALSGDELTTDQAKHVAETFITTPFTMAARHQRRLDKIAVFEHSQV